MNLRDIPFVGFLLFRKSTIPAWILGLGILVTWIGNSLTDGIPFSYVFWISLLVSFSIGYSTIIYDNIFHKTKVSIERDEENIFTWNTYRDINKLKSYDIFDFVTSFMVIMGAYFMIFLLMRMDSFEFDFKQFMIPVASLLIIFYYGSTTYYRISRYFIYRQHKQDMQIYRDNRMGLANLNL